MLGCFDRLGQRFTGDRTKSTQSAGWQALHVAIDDHFRVGFSQIPADDKATGACTFLLAALRYYKTLGVQIERVMTDNGSAYKSRRSAVAAPPGHQEHSYPSLHAAYQRQAERFIQTLLRAWAMPSLTADGLRLC